MKYNSNTQVVIYDKMSNTRVHDGRVKLKEKGMQFCNGLNEKCDNNFIFKYEMMNDDCNIKESTNTELVMPDDAPFFQEIPYMSCCFELNLPDEAD